MSSIMIYHSILFASPLVAQDSKGIVASTKSDFKCFLHKTEIVFCASNQDTNWTEMRFQYVKSIYIDEDKQSICALEEATVLNGKYFEKEVKCVNIGSKFEAKDARKTPTVISKHAIKTNTH
eukprot:NODE_89_length_21781_cov_0.895836.p20 type:complete len:122 gc:universal NODE_89_length_21781_cov_0.895836:16145-15780(-)